MSNPLLNPDPRFQKPPPIDAAGQNHFADQETDEAEQSTDASAAPSAFEPSSASSERPFEPRYVATAQSRETFLLILAFVGLAGAACGATSITGILVTGWLLPLVAVFAAGPAWVLAFKDLGEMHLGGRNDSGRSPTMLALWLGVGGMLACIASVVWMIILEMGPLPDIL
ncbi:MAG: hypothetical protein L0211_02205 [Planctomycetaceae bacterium]|nr:hypothetical protein [Planctomycetaceae bacterium]